MFPLFLKFLLLETWPTMPILMVHQLGTKCFNSHAFTSLVQNYMYLKAKHQLVVHTPSQQITTVQILNVWSSVIHSDQRVLDPKVIKVNTDWGLGSTGIVFISDECRAFISIEGVTWVVVWNIGLTSDRAVGWTGWWSVGWTGGWGAYPMT